MFRADHELSGLFLRISVAARPSPPVFGVRDELLTQGAWGFSQMNLVSISLGLHPSAAAVIERQKDIFMVAGYSWAGKIQAEIQVEIPVPEILIHGRRVSRGHGVLEEPTLQHSRERNHLVTRPLPRPDWQRAKNPPKSGRIGGTVSNYLAQLRYRMLLRHPPPRSLLMSTTSPLPVDQTARGILGPRGNFHLSNSLRLQVGALLDCLDRLRRAAAGLPSCRCWYQSGARGRIPKRHCDNYEKHND
jgi:hypothetical protein